MLAPGKGKTKTARLWTYVRDDRPAGYETAPAVWFAYPQDRKGEHPRQHLKDFRGALQADAYLDFIICMAKAQIYEAACWAHARRKFYDIHVAHASPRRGGYATDRSTVRNRGRDSRQAAELAARYARREPGHSLDSLSHWMEKALRSLSTQERDGSRHPLRALPLACS